MMKSRFWDLKSLFAFIWMIFTLALAIWLSIFHSRLFDSIAALNTPESQAIVKHHRMIGMELATMIVALLIGGSSLFYLIYLERKQSGQIRSFFAIFSHELKTSLARLRLQAEGIGDDLRKSGRGGPALRLLDDMGKLEVQLENSLWIARDKEDRLLIEWIPLSKIMSEFATEFPLTVHLSANAELQADSRALESIFKNIFQNSVIHGDSQNLWIDVHSENDQMVLLEIRDDGRGFDGNRKELGQIFGRHTQTSGTGLGLHLIKRLCERLGGSARFLPSHTGFHIEMKIPGRTKATVNP